MMRNRAPLVLPAAQEADGRALVDGELELIVIATTWAGGIEAFDEVAALLDGAFATEAGRILWAVTRQEAAEGRVGIGGVANRLYESGQIDRIGSGSLVDIYSKAIGIDPIQFAKTLATKKRRRRALALAQKISRTIEVGDTPSPDDLEDLREVTLPSPIQQGFCIEDLPPVGATQEAVEYIIPDVLPKGALVGFTGAPGCGKTTFIATMGRNAIAQGIPFLVLDRENPRSHVYALMTRIGLEDGPLNRWFGLWADGEPPGPGSALIDSYVRSCPVPPVIVFDSVVAHMPGQDENSATAMRAFTAPCRALTALGATIILTHHDGKGENTRFYRGSSDFPASVDQAFHISNTSSDGTLDRLRLHCYKSRFGFFGDIVYRYADGRMLRDDREDAPQRNKAEQLTGLLRMKPGIAQEAFEKLAQKQNIARHAARDFLNDGVLGGLIRRETGTKNKFSHYLVGGPDDPI